MEDPEGVRWGLLKSTEGESEQKNQATNRGFNTTSIKILDDIIQTNQSIDAPS